MAEEFDPISGRTRSVPGDEPGDVPLSNGKAGGQPKQEKEPWADLNLDDVPKFRNYKSTMDSKIAQRDSEVAQLRQQYDALQEQLNEARLSGMNEADAAKFRAELAEAQANQYRQQMAEMRERLERESRLKEIAAKGKIPPDILLNAGDPFAALDAVVEHMLRNGATGAEVREAVQSAGQQMGMSPQQPRPAAPRVDLGSGAPVEVKSELQQRYDEAFEQRDTLAALRIMNEADAQGVRLQERTYTR